MYFMPDPQALHVTRNVIPGKLGVDLHLHRVHIPLVVNGISPYNTATDRGNVRQWHELIELLLMVPVLTTQQLTEAMLDNDMDWSKVINYNVTNKETSLVNVDINDCFLF